MFYSKKLNEAVNWSFLLHKDQMRKDGVTPYTVHLMGVFYILSKVTDNEDILIAALLHDLVEDTHVSVDEVAKKFGTKVAKLVSSVTEENKLASWSERKKISLAKISSYNYSQALLKSADITHNVASLRYDVEQNIEVLNNFNAKPSTKIKYEKSRLKEFMNSHPSIPFYKEWEAHIVFLERKLKEL